MAAATPLEIPESPLQVAPDPSPEAASDDTARMRVIRDTVRAHSEALRARFPFLKRYQSEIGLGLLIASLAGMLGAGALYAVGAIPVWLCIPLIAIACSIAHEIEHDLIHNLYYPRNKKIQNAMFATVWAMRPDSISPWLRKDLHIRHHRISGTEGDIEEQSITNGARWGVRRFLRLLDGGLNTALHLPKDRKIARIVLERTARAYFPLGFVHFALWYTFLGFHSAELAASTLEITLGWPAALLASMPVVSFLVAVWIAPNVLRSFSLKFVSSNMHYFGDVERGNVMQQCQVLNRWWLAPFHLFCFNFGSTHAIHHFWVSDPFYLRQATAPAAHKVMRENGVRFNDLGSFTRANRYFAEA
jgi:fatty acid desaturase